MLMNRTALSLSLILAAALLAIAVSISSAKPRTAPTPVKTGPAADANGNVIPPADAQWTLYCQALAGPGHIEQANAVKEQLIGLSKMKDWYIIHQQGES